MKFNDVLEWGNGDIFGEQKFTTYVRMSRDGPEARLDKLARILTLPPEHCLLHVGRDLEDDAEDVERPTDVVLQGTWELF